jgi:hypothetical protein
MHPSIHEDGHARDRTPLQSSRHNHRRKRTCAEISDHTSRTDAGRVFLVLESSPSKRFSPLCVPQTHCFRPLILVNSTENASFPKPVESQAAQISFWKGTMKSATEWRKTIAHGVSRGNTENES